MKLQFVYKYDLPVKNDWVGISMPEGAEVLCVQIQHGNPKLWARVTHGHRDVTRHFRVAGTGHLLGEETGRYIGSFQLDDGNLIFHVFEEVDEK